MKKLVSVAGDPVAQRLQRRALLGEMFSHNPLSCGVGAHIGDLVEPLAELRVEITKGAKATAEQAFGR